MISKAFKMSSFKGSLVSLDTVTEFMMGLITDSMMAHRMANPTRVSPTPCNNLWTLLKARLKNTSVVPFQQ